MSLRCVVWAALAVALTACVTASPHGFTTQEIQTFRLAKVDVIVSPSAVDWGDEVQKYTAAESSGETVQKARDYVRSVAASRSKRS